MMTPELSQKPAFRRGYRMQWEASQNGYVILYPEGMAKLNDSASAILLLVDGNATLSDIIAQLQSRFPEAETLGADVLEFFQLASEHKWVVFHD